MIPAGTVVSTRARRRRRAFRFHGSALVASALLLASGCAGAGAQSAGPPATLKPYAATLPRSAAGDDVELLAAFEFEPRATSFGGISSLLIAGPDLLMLSDRGTLFRARRVLADDSRLLGLEQWRVETLAGSRAVDSEAMAGAADGAVYVSVEGRNRLDVAGAGGLRRGPYLPPTLVDPPENAGIEALSSLLEGGLLAIREAPARDGEFPAAAIRGSGTEALIYHAADGYRPTGADRLGARYFFVERRVSLLDGLSGRVVTDARLAPGVADGAVRPTLLAGLGGSGLSENWEGLAVEPCGGARVCLYVVSDDNFSALQRTLLVQIAWRPPEPPAD